MRNFLIIGLFLWSSSPAIGQDTETEKDVDLLFGRMNQFADSQEKMRAELARQANILKERSAGPRSSRNSFEIPGRVYFYIPAPAAPANVCFSTPPMAPGVSFWPDYSPSYGRRRSEPAPEEESEELTKAFQQLKAKDAKQDERLDALETWRGQTDDRLKTLEAKSSDDDQVLAKTIWNLHQRFQLVEQQLGTGSGFTPPNPNLVRQASRRRR